MSGIRLLALLAALAAVLSGCLSTELAGSSVPPKVFNLAAANHNPLHIQVRFAKPGSSLGHQYLLLAIPFGSVESENVELLVQRALYTKLALRGFTPLVGQQNTAGFGVGAPFLTLDVQDAQASAFDFLIVRRLSCSLELKAQFLKADSERRGYGSGSFKQFGAFAFEKEMSLCFTQALELALDRLLNDLRM